MGPRPSLQNNLDREVLQAVRRYQDEKPENSSLKVHLLYQYIQQSNSSLRRKQKHLIEDSIERVISVLRQDEKDGDESADQSGGATRAASPNFMNRLVVNSWNTTANTSSSLTADSGNAGKKRDSASNTNGEPRKKKRKQEPTGSTIPSKYNLENIGGLDHVAEQLEELLVLPLLEPETYIENKIEIPRGILLHGPPGCGKTLISRAFAAELAVPFIEILGPSVVSGMSGESEQKIREHFEEAKRLAPSILFIDEIDVLAPKRETSQSQMEKRIVAQLLISMDSLEMETNDGKPVIVLAATNRPDSLDPALRRGGRFDTEINLTVPNEKMRESILRTQMREMNVLGDVDFSRLAKMTAGFVGSDLHDLISKAASWTMEKYRQALQEQAMEDDDNNAMDIDDKSRRANPTSETVRRTRLLIRRLRQKDKPKPEGFETMQLRMEAFLTVLPKIQPSSKREGFATVPDTTWEDIGALEEAREKLIKDIVRPIENPEVYERMHVATPAGVLLWGPPGCGKTLLAKAVANESKANFISIKGPELLNKYVGESERAVRQVFTRARSSIPCILFFDELDALVPRRDDTASEASSRVVNTLLTELDGLSAREGIFVVAATNRPDIIDPAMLRPGRLETLVYVGLPSPQGRVSILRALMAKMPVDSALASLGEGESCHGFSGADLASLVRLAGSAAIDRDPNVSRIEEGDILKAMKVVKPSVVDIKHYERLKEKLSRG